MSGSQWPPTIGTTRARRQGPKKNVRPLSFDTENLDGFEQQRIIYHLLSREAGATLQEDGLPFFLKKMQENKMIKANKVHKLRLCSVGKQPQGLLNGPIQPAHGSYILDRMHASEKLYAKFRRQKAMQYGEKYSSVPVSPDHTVEHSDMAAIRIDSEEKSLGVRKVQLAFSLRQAGDTSGQRSPSTGNNIFGNSGLRNDLRVHVNGNSNADSAERPNFPTENKPRERSTKLTDKKNEKSRNSGLRGEHATDVTKRSAEMISPQRKMTQLRKKLGEVNSGGAVSLNSREEDPQADARTKSIGQFDGRNELPAELGEHSLRQLHEQSPTLLYDSGSQGAAHDALQACLRSPTLIMPESKENDLGSGMANDTLSGKAGGGHDADPNHDGDSSRM